MARYVINIAATAETTLAGDLVDGAVIAGRDGDTVCAGLDLRFDNGGLIIGALGDEWVLAADAEPAVVTSHWTRQPLVHGTSN